MLFNLPYIVASQYQCYIQDVLFVNIIWSSIQLKYCSLDVINQQIINQHGNVNCVNVSQPLQVIRRNYVFVTHNQWTPISEGLYSTAEELDPVFILQGILKLEQQLNITGICF